MSWKSLRSIIICPNSKKQFEIKSHVPNEMKSNLMLITLATAETVDTPSSACFVKAMPNPIKNNQNINNIYLLAVSFADIKTPRL